VIIVPEKKLFTSESVTEGHPDKICDQVADAILDAMLAEDPESRVAIECLTTTGLLMIAGEVTTNCYVDIPTVARNTLKEIGYTNPEFGLDGDDCAVLTSIHEQSRNIAIGVDEAKGHEQGAGDQGMMFGYACNETPELMPLPISLAHALTKRLSEARKSGELPWARPDGKAQVTIEYEDEKPKRAEAIVIAVHHDPAIKGEELRAQVIEKVVKPVCGEWMDESTKLFVNATGVFAVGGPEADAGVTGRKIIVDTYGGVGRHGGGAFSGKDPSKVDRSASYAARYIAKNIVAAGLAEKCEVQLAYSIGIAEPVSVRVDCFGTGKVSEEKLVELVRANFALKPADIIRELDLKRPLYKATAAYGHFGRDGFPWEETNKVEALRESAGL